MITKKEFFAFILAPGGLKVEDKIISGESEVVPIQVGNNLPLKFIPTGIPIHNIELKPKKGGQLIRSAGTSAEIVAKGIQRRGQEYCQVKLRSKTEYLILAACRATIGKVGNSEARLVRLGKAGRSR
ncbi:50S ribosomal protein L2 [Glomus cerebriforme]|uniref:50S ribosomal protein L2 n=1 Tax=Glomus cerebriforme TaxID=658196 RepID=A0A397SC75_9GLOM|nr:50S ribosomal protein L2 [Glomus cerebriforme]